MSLQIYIFLTIIIAIVIYVWFRILSKYGG